MLNYSPKKKVEKQTGNRPGPMVDLTLKVNFTTFIPEVFSCSKKLG